MNEALLSGALDVASAGVPPLLTLWDRTKDKQNVKAIASLGSMPNYLLSNNPAVKTIKILAIKTVSQYPQQGWDSSREPCRLKPPNYMATPISNVSII
jgi:NitT/TauT family transport system substrate-binding protein